MYLLPLASRSKSIDEGIAGHCVGGDPPFFKALGHLQGQFPISHLQSTDLCSAGSN